MDPEESKEAAVNLLRHLGKRIVGLFNYQSHFLPPLLLLELHRFNRQGLAVQVTMVYSSLMCLPLFSYLKPESLECRYYTSLYIC